MTLGLEIIKFLLEQHEDNLPIVQMWIDKWFWRGTRLLSIVAMMMDYMPPNKVGCRGKKLGKCISKKPAAHFSKIWPATAFAHPNTAK